MKVVHHHFENLTAIEVHQRRGMGVSHVHHRPPEDGAVAGADHRIRRGRQRVLIPEQGDRACLGIEEFQPVIETLGLCRRSSPVLRRRAGGQDVDDRQLRRHQFGADGRSAIRRILRGQFFDRTVLGEHDRDDARALDHAAGADGDQHVGLRCACGIACGEHIPQRRVLAHRVEYAGKRSAEQRPEPLNKVSALRNRASANDEGTLCAVTFHFGGKMVQRLFPAVDPVGVTDDAEIVIDGRGHVEFLISGRAEGKADTAALASKSIIRTK